jgi:hypothetical protein
MSIVDWLKKAFSNYKSPETKRNYWFYVQCSYCKEILKGRVDLYNHLSIQYGEGKGGNSYYCRKVMIGSKRCYRPIEVEFWFDGDRKLADRQIKGGKYVAECEYPESKVNPK